MGHIHLGVLPKTRKWQEVVALISDGATDAAIISASARAAEKDLLNAANDPVFVEAVRLLAIVPISARAEDFGQSLRDHDVTCGSAPVVFGIVVGLASRLDDIAAQTGRRNDFHELARRALLSTVTAYLGDRIPRLIGPTSDNVHRAARQLSAPREFSAYARGFFTRLLGETLRYWLDRELANHTGPGKRFANARSRSEFDHALMQYSMEATRIIKEFADTTVRRGGDNRQRLGATWRRDLVFRLAVRHSEFWSQPDVTAALTDAVEFLTGDRVTVEFVEKPTESVVQSYLPLENAQGGFQAKEIILFSGGLDSFAGAFEALRDRKDNVILVTHRSAPKAITRQVRLSEILREKFDNRFLHLHVRATRAGSVSSETTQRSRSFLFASLGYAVARMAGADWISFYENGVVSHNLPIDAQVIETMASRTTHPLALRKLQTFLDLLGGKRVVIHNEFEWLTKAEVLTKIHDLGASPAIPYTVSCTSLRNETSDIHHCGTCSQCLDRRFAILAAGLEDYDNASDYKIDVITGARESVRSRTMALDWTRHACMLGPWRGKQKALLCASHE